MNKSKVHNIVKKIRKNKFFEAFVLFVIITSAIVVGAKTFKIPDYLENLLSYLDTLITIIFVTEIMIRYSAEDVKMNFFKSGWNIFDSIVVLVILIPFEGSEIALVGRLIRIFRVLRMISLIPELKLLVDAFFKALPQLMYVLGLMFIIFYIYGGIGSTFFAEINQTLWGNIAISMLTLFRVMTLEDWTDVMYETMEVYPMSWIYYISFIFLSAFAFLNMIIGIIVGVINTESHKYDAPSESEIKINNIEKKIKDISNAHLDKQLQEIKQILKKKL